MITPWDEYIHGKERLFADPADFADLYIFWPRGERFPTIEEDEMKRWILCSEYAATQ